MTILVVGASGATGRLLVAQLLNRGLNVKVIVRSPDKLPEVLKSHDKLSVGLSFQCQTACGQRSRPKRERLAGGDLRGNQNRWYQSTFSVC